jgi:hypothetical protein
MPKPMGLARTTKHNPSLPKKNPCYPFNPWLKKKPFEDTNTVSVNRECHTLLPDYTVQYLATKKSIEGEGWGRMVTANGHTQQKTDVPVVAE